jgi:hypothetical protein
LFIFKIVFLSAEFYESAAEPLLDLLTIDELIIEEEGIAIETIPPALERIRAAPIPDDDLPGN